MQKVKTVVFDLDGTLADTSMDLVEAARNVLGKREMCSSKMSEKSLERAKMASRSGGIAIIRSLCADNACTITPDQEQEIFQEFLAAYEKDIVIHTQLYPNVLETLAMLRSQEWNLSVCTNKKHELALVVLDALGVTEYFSSIIGAGVLEVKKPDSAMFTETLRKGGGLVEYSVMVGDTCTDLLLARNAGVPCVLFNVPESIADWPPYDKVDIVDDFSEIPTVIEQWF